MNVLYVYIYIYNILGVCLVVLIGVTGLGLARPS